ncbi:MAG TPA: DNA polymerase III subunit delta [Casimicrobiaceae bacterium]|nr:DNA polymerase III subunit delta [Casimicrobiaceae bacterium]
MQLRPAQLAAHLADGVQPLYVVHGEETLLVLEAGDQIRAAARAAGFDQREIFVADQGFRWDAFAAAQRNLGLFGERRFVDLSLPSGKPGVEGARVLEDHASHLADDTVTLITLPRLDRAAQGAAWFTALERSGVSVAVYPVERDELPRWLAQRLARQGQRTGAETLQFLADATEGNLLAAKQEIDKLGLLLPEGALEHEQVLRAVADVARFDVFQLSEAWLVGDASRALRILAALEAAGEGVPLILWQLGEDLHALALVLAAAATGTPIPVAVRNARVWGKRQSAMERAAGRVDPATLRALLMRLARLDALAKGIGQGSVWEELADAALALCGRSLDVAEHAPA